MTTALRIAHTIAAINLLRPAETQLQAPEGFSSDSDLSEFYLVHQADGQLAAIGYSEADLLANLQKLREEEVRQTFQDAADRLKEATEFVKAGGWQ